ncbi:MAG: hypothetical protein ACRDSI_10775 [Pseudonocardiaceae bacterium]
MERDGAVAGFSRIGAGVERTLAEGSAEVEIDLEYSFPGEPAEGSLPAAMSTHYRGVVDFRSDRASLADGDMSLLLEGAATYQRMPDGVWTHTHQAGRTGQWTCTHPRWALEVLRQACRSDEPDSRADVEVELDRDRAADVTHPGLNPDWQVRASTAFDDAGRLRRIEITMAGSASPDAWMRNTVEFTRFDQAAARIDLPDNSVHLAGYLRSASPGQDDTAAADLGDKRRR